jgi:hydroxymethylpyrimidine pyrophosphatase-like HAD family hydrolase
MKTLYISDMDGTLLQSNGKMSDFTKEKLNEWIQAGVGGIFVSLNGSTKELNEKTRDG